MSLAPTARERATDRPGQHFISTHPDFLIYNRTACKVGSLLVRKSVFMSIIEAGHPLAQLLRRRIVILDGAMGTMVQRYRLDEAAFRGARFADWRGKDQKGNNELLLLTRPQVVEEIHRLYLEAGADIVETNTFSATTIGQHDFLFSGHPDGRKDQAFFEQVVTDASLVDLAIEMNVVAARLARQAADGVAQRTGSPRFVAGALGPMPVTASLSPEVSDAGFRAVNFDQLRRSYRQQVEALMDGGVDLSSWSRPFSTH
jgi:5-methyltetrahydrofolate--homocysteine methyltransferase